MDEATRGIGDIIDDISVWYTRRSRERLKGDQGEASQSEALATLSYTLITLAKVMAPVMPFIAERVYKSVGGSCESVHLEKWPETGEVRLDVIEEMKSVREAVSLALMKRTANKINVKQPLSSVTLKKPLKEEYFNLLKDEVNVKNIIIDENLAEEVALDTNLNEDLIKEGDMRKLIRAVQDMRKSNGLVPADEITLTLSSDLSLGDVHQLLSTCKVKEIKTDSSIKDISVELSSGTLYVSLVKTAN